MKNVVVTTADRKYYESLLTLISSLYETSNDVVDKIFVYDLGLDPEEKKQLLRLEKVEVIDYPADCLSIHPKFMEGKSYVYKLYCLHDMIDCGAENVLWLDAGVCALKPIREMFDKIESDEIFTVVDVHKIGHYTHSECKRIMGTTISEENSPMLSAGIIGYKTDGKYIPMIREAYRYGLIPGCCDGDQENHRHDQSILSVLVCRYNCPTSDINRYGYWTDASRNLQSARQADAVIFVHRRGHHNIDHLKRKADR